MGSVDQKADIAPRQGCKLSPLNVANLDIISVHEDHMYGHCGNITCVVCFGI